MQNLVRFLSFSVLVFIPAYAVQTDQSTEALYHWDKVVWDLTKQSPLPNRGSDRLRGYLYKAQKNYCLKDPSVEKINQVSAHVINLFYPNYQSGVANNCNLTPFLDQRFQKEKKHIAPLALSKKEGAWEGKNPYHGMEIPNWMPWVLRSVDEFRVPPPPQQESFWQDQLAQVKAIMAQASDQQKERVLYWADPVASDWIEIANQYMQKKGVPLQKQLIVRDALGRAVVDATIAVFDSKYTYRIKRPSMVDPTLKTYIDTPNHPSFPSAHSGVSAAVVEILDYYFPENQAEWKRLLEEAGMSRIWGGIHFPVDHDVGKMIGRKVGQAILQRS